MSLTVKHVIKMHDRERIYEYIWPYLSVKHSMKLLLQLWKSVNVQVILNHEPVGDQVAVQ